ncbi:SRPBCC family protein [Azospirillum sp. TSO35-2]|uniref:SRPBCC family protein n=1 Tax=Azospirillum sp. TSO35-2 TaxID=716796 RepID=UPI000D6119BA|nr:SRPBCC family protein [Azospirillum sp. TSO35-2]PWC33186.1 hypothetical protein TSO352_21920 [Azospirillum sp. TSO35-2]
MTKTDALTADAANEREIVMTRVLPAPRTAVFDALLSPDQLRRWLTPRGLSLAVCEVDPMPGGRFRYVWRVPGMPDFGMAGVYHEVERPSRVVHSERCESMPDGADVQVTTALAERDDGTLLTLTLRYPDRATRDAMLASDMTKGVAECYDALAALLSAPR